jgi:hypothetical protein
LYTASVTAYSQNIFAEFFARISCANMCENRPTQNLTEELITYYYCNPNIVADCKLFFTLGPSEKI